MPLAAPGAPSGTLSSASNPAQSPSPGANPASPYNPSTLPIPDPSSYAAAAALANNAYAKALAQINSNRLSTLTQYGYTGQIDPTTGDVTGVTVDPNSTYGSLQQLLHGEAVADMGAENALHDRGVYGGLAHQAADESHYQYGAQKTQLGETLQSALAALQGEQQSADETRNSAIGDAENTALQNELSQENSMNPADWLSAMLSGVGSSGAPPAPKPSPAPKPAKAPAAKQKAVKRVVNSHRHPKG